MCFVDLDLLLVGGKELYKNKLKWGGGSMCFVYPDLLVVGGKEIYIKKLKGEWGVPCVLCIQISYWLGARNFI